MRNVFEYYEDDDILSHHGIKGQKWGVRRFQNPDGTLTEAGKRRLKSFKDYENIANKNAERLYREADSIKSTNEKMHQRYDGKEGYKRYIEDAYPGSKAEDYGISETDFKKWMASELSANMKLSDAQDKATYDRYYKAAKEWEDQARGLKNVDVSSITNKDVKAMKRLVSMYNNMEILGGGFSLDDLVIGISDKKK